jgi:hypothetical protein
VCFAVFLSFLSPVFRCDVSDDGHIDRKEFADMMSVAVRLLFSSSHYCSIRRKFASFFSELLLADDTIKHENLEPIGTTLISSINNIMLALNGYKKLNKQQFINAYGSISDCFPITDSIIFRCKNFPTLLETFKQKK